MLSPNTHGLKYGRNCVIIKSCYPLFSPPSRQLSNKSLVLINSSIAMIFITCVVCEISFSNEWA